MKHFVKSVALPATAMKTVGRTYKQLTHLVNIRKYVFVHLLRPQQCEQAEKKINTVFYVCYTRTYSSITQRPMVPYCWH